MAVVFGHAANAFACRSSTRWQGALGWTSNPLLIPAVAIGVGILLALLVGPITAELGHANPSPIGWSVALAAAGVRLIVDAADKRKGHGT